VSTHTSPQSKAAKVNVSDGFNPEDVRNLSSVLNALLADVTKNKQGNITVENYPLDSFFKAVQDVHNTSGWYETVTKILQISKTAKHGGALATVYYHGGASTTPGGKPVEDGDTMALLMYDGKRWWVVSDTW